MSYTYQNGADDDHAELLGERREELGGGALLGALRELAPRMLLAGAERERHRCKESSERLGAFSRSLYQDAKRSLRSWKWNGMYSDRTDKSKEVLNREVHLRMDLSLVDL